MFTPDPPPLDQPVPVVVAWAYRQFERLATEQARGATVQLVTESPRSPQDGMMIRTIDSGWNPGGGSGLYIYGGSLWYKYTFEAQAYPHS